MHFKQFVVIEIVNILSQEGVLNEAKKARDFLQNIKGNIPPSSKHPRRPSRLFVRV